MPTTADKLRELRTTVHGNFDKIMRKYYDDVNAQERGLPLPYDAMDRAVLREMASGSKRKSK